jgi:hypothetical protein
MFRFALLFLLLSGCGQSLDIPEDIPITHLPADEEFVLTVVMESCSDTCAKYDEPECSVSIDEEEMILRIDAHVGYESGVVESCISTCGVPILAHCEIEALKAGTWLVTSRGFEHEIILE